MFKNKKAELLKALLVPCTLIVSLLNQGKGFSLKNPFSEVLMKAIGRGDINTKHSATSHAIIRSSMRMIDRKNIDAKYNAINPAIRTCKVTLHILKKHFLQSLTRSLAQSLLHSGCMLPPLLRIIK